MKIGKYGIFMTEIVVSVMRLLGISIGVVKMRLVRTLLNG
jgi:hypothetical protein